jgi:uncharacterized membrane protein YphA (DoxX/SURF4 family)
MKHKVTEYIAEAALSLIQFVIGYEWLSSGVRKIVGGTFAPTIDKTIETFSNGTEYKWYSDLILSRVKENSLLFGIMIQWAECVVGFVLIIYSLNALFRWKPLSKQAGMGILIACGVGILLNVNFYLAAGWTSASTKGLNIVMLFQTFILFVYWYLKAYTSSESQTELVGGK